VPNLVPRALLWRLSAPRCNSKVRCALRRREARPSEPPGLRLERQTSKTISVSNLTNGRLAHRPGCRRVLKLRNVSAGPPVGQNSTVRAKLEKNLAKSGKTRAMEVSSSPMLVYPKPSLRISLLSEMRKP